MSDKLREYAQHIRDVRSASKNELLHVYLDRTDQVSKAGQIAFILRGNIQWQPEEEDTGLKDIWLKSGYFEMTGKHISANPIRGYLQLYLNLYDIGGTIKVEFPPEDIETARVEITRVLTKVLLLKNSFSFVTGASLDLIPAFYEEVEVRNNTTKPPASAESSTKQWKFLPVQATQEHRTSSIINKEVVNSILATTQTLSRIKDPVGAIIRRALDWHANGNKYTNNLNRYVNYWASIELLGSYFFEKLEKRTIGKKTKSQKKSALKKKLKEFKTDKPDLSTIEDCYAIINPPIKEKLLAFLTLLDKKKGADIHTKLFDKDDISGKSLYQIRNDIAHGSISDQHFEEIGALQKRLFDAGQISREIIHRAILKSTELNRLHK